MTTYVLAFQHRIAQEWVTREGLALAVGQGGLVTPDVAHSRLYGLGANSTVIVLETPHLGVYSFEVEQLLSTLAQTRVTVIRLNPDYQHGDVAVRPVEPDFTPPEFETAEEALEWLEKMEKVRQEVRSRTYHSRLNGQDVTLPPLRRGDSVTFTTTHTFT